MSYYHKITIFYQSMEYPRNFRRILLNKLLPNLEKVKKKHHLGFYNLDCKPKSLGYMEKLKQMLTAYIENLKKIPDLIILGEYTPINPVIHGTFFQVLGEEYCFGGCVNTKPIGGSYRGTRGMAIFYRKGTNIDRISIHEHSRSNDIWLRDLHRSPGREEKRKDIIKLWKDDVVTHVDPCAEVMFRNRYLAVAHVPELGANAKNRACNAMNSLQHYRLLGDLNVSNDAGFNSGNHLTEENVFNHNHQLEINTDCSKILNNDKSIFAEIQLHANVSGKTHPVM